MSLHRVAERYVKSLIELAEERGGLEAVVTDMKLLKEGLNSEELRQFLRSPIINSLRKREILSKIFQGHVSELTFSFIRILALKGRENVLPDIIDTFEMAYKERMGISTIQLTTATPLNEKMLESIRKKIQASEDTRETIELVTEVDPELISGFLLDFDNKQYDASVKHQLDTLAKSFTASQ